ncbi:hypothetical protein DSCW_18230 [Desulfosarcina widdelii]|uniref:DUF2184 domain-containing protein n=1 Tax=Desulfosarcina widdelii TaxID=947919 RepID=A0A5K7YYE8_9BACT|nr:DUF2184 domain-containing protein [Desulfosarcina widdelii]BBO74406.1 hypothetical protein DSCW_18230 [Desulfosarcina widdelii]
MIRIDAVRVFLDAIDQNAALFTARQLEAVEAEIYRYKERELKYRYLIPVSNRDNPGAETITYIMYDRVGMAKIISDYSQDLPRADVYGKSVSHPVRSLGIAVGYNRQEIRAAMMAGVGLETEKAAAQRRGIREKESAIAWTGHSASGIPGFLTNSSIPTLAALNGDAGTPDWASKTPDEIITDVRLMTAKVRSQSKGVHEADTMLLPNEQYDLIAGTPRSAQSDVTILEFILSKSDKFGLKTIEPMYGELDNAFVSGTKDGAVIYEKSRENFELRIPMELTVYPAQEKGLEMIVPGESRIGGVVVRYPLAFLFFTGI